MKKKTPAATSNTHSHAHVSASPADAPTSHAADASADEATATATSTVPPATTTTSASSGLAIPSEEQITQLVSLLEGVRTMLGPVATPLTKQQRKHALRFRRGGEPTIGLMASLGQQYKVQHPGVDPAAIVQNNLLVQRLQPLETKLRVISGLVTDTVGNAKTESWQGTTALYTALTRASTRNAALQKELAPAVEFFKKGSTTSSATPKTSKKKGATAETTDAAPAPAATAGASVPAADAAPAPAAKS